MVIKIKFPSLRLKLRIAAIEELTKSDVKDVKKGVANCFKL